MFLGGMNFYPYFKSNLYKKRMNFIPKKEGVRKRNYPKKDRVKQVYQKNKDFLSQKRNVSQKRKYPKKDMSKTIRPKKGIFIRKRNV